MQCKLAFYANECVMLDNLRNMSLPLGNARRALYYLYNDSKVVMNTRTHIANASLSDEDNEKLHKLMIWHVRFGHLPFNKIQIVFPKLNGKGLEKSCFASYDSLQDKQDQACQEK